MIEPSNAQPQVRADFISGQLYRDTRPEELSKLQKRLIHGRKMTVLRPPTRSPKQYLRVLSVLKDHVVLISTIDPVANPQFVPTALANGLVHNGDWRITDIEPLSVLRLDPADLTEKQIHCRDRRIEILRPLIDLGEEILYKEKRWPAIVSVAKRKRCRPEYIFRLVRRYLQAGMSTQGLAGNWYRRTGDIGIGSKVDWAASAGVQRKSAGRHRLDGHPAFVVTQADPPKIIAGARKYYFSGETAGDWTGAWLLTAAEFYLELDCRNGIPSKEELKKFKQGTYPSRTQFTYWAKSDKNYEQLLKKLHTERGFQLRLRRRRNKTATTARGPGAIFLIDATPLDWTLVHQHTRKPLERDAKLYLVVDAYSHLIVGVYLHLGSESYDATSVAMLNTAEDKVEFCRRFGVDISPDDWPSACLCTELRGDGVCASYKHGILVEHKIIRSVTIVPGYRADLKGLVEAYNSALEQFARGMPGHSKGKHKRGEEKADATACLDYFESMKIIISWILQRNNRVIKNYAQTPEMLAEEGFVASPINLWIWGCINASGGRKVWPRQQLMKLCLPRSSAMLTRDGLEFEGRLYEPPEGVLPEFKDWCCLAAETESWPVEISHHPSSYSDFWLHHEDELVKMQHAPRSQMYAKWCEAEGESFKKSQAVANAKHRSDNDAKNIALKKYQYDIIQSAKDLTNKVRGSVAKRRSEKTDKSVTTENQKALIGGLPPSMPDIKPHIKSGDALMADDEDFIVTAISQMKKS